MVEIAWPSLVLKQADRKSSVKKLVAHFTLYAHFSFDTEIQLSARHRQNASLRIGDAAAVTQIVPNAVTTTNEIILAPLRDEDVDFAIDQVFNIYAKELLGMRLVSLKPSNATSNSTKRRWNDS